MRLIDVDKLWTDIMRLIDADELAPMVKRLIEMAPTVDPVKHGRWVRMEKVFPNLPNDSVYRFECSTCGWSDQHNDKMVVPYCWHCGALMDGESNETD